MMDPTTGSWLTEDPIGFSAGDMNKYRYVGNSPTNFTDPTGLVEVTWTQDGVKMKVTYQVPEGNKQSDYYKTYTVPPNPKFGLDGTVVAVSGVKYLQIPPKESEYKPVNSDSIILEYNPAKGKEGISAEKVGWLQFVTYRIKWTFLKDGVEQEPNETYGGTLEVANANGRARTNSTKENPVYFVDSKVLSTPCFVESLSRVAATKDV